VRKECMKFYTHHVNVVGSAETAWHRLIVLRSRHLGSQVKNKFPSKVCFPLAVVFKRLPTHGNLSARHVLKNFIECLGTLCCTLLVRLSTWTDLSTLLRYRLCSYDFRGSKNGLRKYSTLHFSMIVTPLKPQN
jgi:hypothetical protein